ncbi:MAG: hypothetical protein GQ533_12840 [Methanosarcinaceae archaeon]|nr:hypothetical protein [Methanosarcinaceae archaeon]
MISEILAKIYIKKKPILAAENKDFIKTNRDFWSGYSVKNGNHKILIEEPSIPEITHANGVFSIILNQAKSFTPIWLHSNGCEIELLKSYVPTAEYLKMPLSSINKLKLFFVALNEFLTIYKTKDILSFSYDDVRYGDIVYDTYLATFKVATIKKIDLNLIPIIYFCICRHEGIQKILNQGNFEAVLVSHTIGINSGVMLRTALHYGYKGYHHQRILRYLKKPDDVYEYPFKPYPKVVNDIISNLGPDFNMAYKEVFDGHVSGKGNPDAIYAFSKDNRLYMDKKSFCNDYGLDANKKNVFVMLHAFTDHPHSHFRWMIFKDYYDWFIKTLEFAKTDNTINWIFKQHPSIKFYPTKDVTFEKLFANCPQNIVYLSKKNQIDTRSVGCLADLIVTCIGSAGYELPAMSGIPSLIAGDTFYNGLGFTLEPNTKKEYFDFLRDAHNVNKLSPEQQKRARAAYIYINDLLDLNLPTCPIISHEESSDSNANIWYWKKIEVLYDNNGRIIRGGLHRFIDDVAKLDFKKFNNHLKYLK